MLIFYYDVVKFIVTSKVCLSSHACVTGVNLLSQVTVDDNTMIERWDHTITAITISSTLVVGIVFGGWDKKYDKLANTVVLEFGEYSIKFQVHFMYYYTCTLMCLYFKLMGYTSTHSFI